MVWYEKSFSERLQNTLKGKGNKTKLVEGALNELTYEQLKEYLFVPFCSQNLSNVLESELTKEHMESLSKEEIASIIDKCRSISLWDRFFGKYKKFQNFKERIDELQPYRNMVMHHKRINQQEYENVRKSLKSVNKLLADSINVLEENIYTETRLVDVVSALGNMISGILGDYVPTWVENMKSTLASFGRVVIEAAMPQINIPDVIPQLTLGAEMSQYFQSVYNVPQIDISAIEAAKAIYNSPGIKMASEMVAQVGQISSMYDAPGIKNMMAAAEALNTPAVRLASEMAERANRMNAIFAMPTIESITATANAMNFYGKEVADGVEDDEEQLPIDLSDSND